MEGPFQCLQKSRDVLIAASGSRIDSFSLQDGSVLSSWYCPYAPNNSTKRQQAKKFENSTAQNSESPSMNDLSNSAPVPKRRKLSGSEIVRPGVSENGGSNGANRKQKGSSAEPYDVSQAGLGAPTVVTLAISNDGSHVIAVTGDDKAIRVFRHDGVGHLVQLSKRPMPKRPSAIAITDDGSTVICADKFGDVYSIPLLIPEPTLETVDPVEAPRSISPFPTPPVIFKPAANDLTVHSVRNRRALKNQLRQDQQRSEKADPHFNQNLLLGHVSMLTDIALVKNGGRSYIITADRDEHIRVSRGIPQSHVIEGFCLGHSEFVSRLCLPNTRNDLLISGGGDDELFVWNWIAGECLHKLNLRAHVEEVMSVIDSSHVENRVCEEPMAEPPSIAISNIKHLKLGDDDRDFIIVTCEGIPSIFFFTIGADSSLSHSQTLQLEGNPLDILADSASGTFIVSIDSIHARSSTTRIRDVTGPKVQRLQVWRMGESQWTRSDLVFHYKMFELEMGVEGALTGLSTILYTVENLRKRGGEE